MKRRIIFSIAFFYVFSTFVFSVDFLPEADNKTAVFTKSAFKPTIKPHLGLIFKSSFQQAGGTDYNFQPGLMKLGFAGFIADITPKISAVGTYRIHSGGAICDAFVHYKAMPYLDVKLGRFKGSGVKASNETGAYDLEAGEFTYLSENMSYEQGARDLRHWGIDVSAKCEWGKAGFFLHNNDFDWPGYFSTMNDGNPRNRGLAFKSWDASLSITPMKQLEFGGHVGSVNFPGMGNATKMVHSAFFYLIEPGLYTFKFDYGHYYRIDVEGGLNFKNYEERPWSSQAKKGFSFLAAYHINKEFQVVARYERADHATIKDETLNMYTLAVNYYIPKLSSRNKITLYTQFREEKVSPIKNNLISVQYQFVL